MASLGPSSAARLLAPRRFTGRTRRALFAASLIFAQHGDRVALRRSPAMWRKLLKKEWPRKMKALREPDAGRRLQIGQCLKGLDTLGDDRHSERKAQRLDRLEHALAAGTLVDGGDE